MCENQWIDSHMIYRDRIQNFTSAPSTHQIRQGPAHVPCPTCINGTGNHRSWSVHRLRRLRENASGCVYRAPRPERIHPWRMFLHVHAVPLARPALIRPWRMFLSVYVVSLEEPGPCNRNHLSFDIFPMFTSLAHVWSNIILQATPAMKTRHCMALQHSPWTYQYFFLRRNLQISTTEYDETYKTLSCSIKCIFFNSWFINP